MPNTTLALVRHGQSEWNAKNLFTGWRDPDLTELGIQEAHEAGKLLYETATDFAIAFTSSLTRAQHTLRIMLAEMDRKNLETIADQALNERDYGDLSGLNKDDARERWGAEQVHIWRRSFDVPPPGGESLKMTAERVLPYYETHILPRLKSGENVLISAHGNSLRALIMSLEGLTGEQIVKRELATGAPILYRMDGATPVARTDYDGGTAKTTALT